MLDEQQEICLHLPAPAHTKMQEQTHPEKCIRRQWRMKERPREISPTRKEIKMVGAGGLHHNRPFPSSISSPFSLRPPPLYSPHNAVSNKSTTFYQ